MNILGGSCVRDEFCEEFIKFSYSRIQAVAVFCWNNEREA